MINDWPQNVQIDILLYLEAILCQIDVVMEAIIQNVYFMFDIFRYLSVIYKYA